MKWEAGCECWVSGDLRDADYGEVIQYRPECPVHGESYED